MLETYENVLNSSNSLETQKQSATDEIKKINDTKNSIMICENLIQTKGFENNVIFVNGDSISVVIRSDEMTQEEVAQVQNIISREMKAEIENIHISTK
jgi:stage III sporulation protein AH